MSSEKRKLHLLERLQSITNAVDEFDGLPVYLQHDVEVSIGNLDKMLMRLTEPRQERRLGERRT